MPLFTITASFTQTIEANSGPDAEEHIRQAFEMPPDARIEAEGPIDAMGGDKQDE